MPPLIALAMAGASLYMAGRLVSSELGRVVRAGAAKKAKRRRRLKAKPKPVVIKLDRDPTSGVYRYKGADEV